METHRNPPAGTGGLALPRRATRRGCGSLLIVGRRQPPPRLPPAPLDRSRVAVVQVDAQGARHVPRAAGHVGSAVDDGDRDLAPVRRVPEGHQRPARQAPVRDTEDLARVRLAAGRPGAEEPRAIPADVRVEAPEVLDHDLRLRGRLARRRAGPRKRPAARLEQRPNRAQASRRGPTPGRSGWSPSPCALSGRAIVTGIRVCRIDRPAGARWTRGRGAGNGDQSGRGHECRERNDDPGSHVFIAAYPSLATTCQRAARRADRMSATAARPRAIGCGP